MIVTQTSPQVEAALSGPITHYSASPLARCLDKHGVVSFEYLRSRDYNELAEILNEIKTDRSLDILQRMAIRVCLGNNDFSPISFGVCLEVVLIGVFTIILGVGLGIFGFYEGSIDYSLAVMNDIGGCLTILCSVIIGVILIAAGVRRKASGRSFMISGVVVLIFSIVMSVICIILVSIYGGIIMVSLIAPVAVQMIVKGKKMSTQLPLTTKPEDFDVLSVAFLNKAYGGNWTNIPEYNHLKRYPIERIRATIEQTYKTYPQDLPMIDSIMKIGGV